MYINERNYHEPTALGNGNKRQLKAFIIAATRLSYTFSPIVASLPTMLLPNRPCSPSSATGSRCQLSKWSAMREKLPRDSPGKSRVSLNRVSFLCSTVQFKRRVTFLASTSPAARSYKSNSFNILGQSLLVRRFMRISAPVLLGTMSFVSDTKV